MDDPFFDKDDGEFDDLYEQRPTSSKPRRSEASAAPMVTPTAQSAARSPAASSSAASRSYVDKARSSTSNRTDLSTSRRRGKHRRRDSQELFQVKWEADAAVKKCGLCRSDFSLARRKHHCRHCGRVMCGDCSVFLFFEFTNRKHRVCATCNNQLLEEQEEFERETMLPGGSEDSRLFEDTCDEEKVGTAVPGTPVSSDVGGGRQSKMYSTLLNAMTPKHDDERTRRKQEKRDRKERKKRGKEGRKRPLTEPTAGITPNEVTVNEMKKKAPDSGGALFDAVDDVDDGWFADVPEQSSTSGDDHLDKSMTLDELNVPADESRNFTPVVPHSTAPVNTTFYDDDVDKLVVDDSPGFFEATVAEREAEKKKKEQRQQQLASDMAWVNNSALSTMPQRFSSEQESYSLVDPPSHTSNSPVEQEKPAATRNGKYKKGGFAGALKRFFGMGSKATAKSLSPSNTTEEAVTSRAVRREKPNGEIGISTVTRHASSKDVLESAPNDPYLARHTVVDLPGSRRNEVVSEESFRYTMDGYVDTKSTTAAHFEPFETKVKSKTIGEKAEHRVKRRDTFDGLFESPRNNLAASGTDRQTVTGAGWGATIVESSNFSRASAVGVARFDQRRPDDYDGGFILDRRSVNDAAVVRRSSTALSAVNDLTETAPGDSRFTWSNVQSTAGFGTATYAVPTSLRPNTVSQASYDLRNASAENAVATGSIMDDLKRDSIAPKPRGEESVDDYFAEFEERNDYVFDPSTGGYVASAPPPRANARAPVSRSEPTTLQPSQMVPGETLTLHRELATDHTVSTTEADNEEVGDKVADIIVDKISSLEGELAALKQLIRNRKTGGGSSPAHEKRDSRQRVRKESIFDNDSDDDDKSSPAASWQRLQQKSKRRPGSKKRFPKKRKDSFAGLFDSSSDEKEMLGNTASYEELFQIESKAGTDEKNRTTNARNDRSTESKQRLRHKSLDVVEGVENGSAENPAMGDTGNEVAGSAIVTRVDSSIPPTEIDNAEDVETEGFEVAMKDTAPSKKDIFASDSDRSESDKPTTSTSQGGLPKRRPSSKKKVAKKRKDSFADLFDGALGETETLGSHSSYDALFQIEARRGSDEKSKEYVVDSPTVKLSSAPEAGGVDLEEATSDWKSLKKSVKKTVDGEAKLMPSEVDEEVALHSALVPAIDSNEADKDTPSTSTPIKQSQKKHKRRPSSKKKLPKKRKDSFADLFDSSLEEKQALGAAPGYDTLFETEQTGNSDEEKEIPATANSHSTKPSHSLSNTMEVRSEKPCAETEVRDDGGAEAAKNPSAVLADVSSNWMALTREDNEALDLDLSLDLDNLSRSISGRDADEGNLKVKLSDSGEPLPFEEEAQKEQDTRFGLPATVPATTSTPDLNEPFRSSPPSSVDDDAVAFEGSTMSSNTSSRTPSVDGSPDAPVDEVDDQDPLLGKVDAQEFDTDWQQMQAKEKERKKRLQLKQRQAQREKVLRKQGASTRSVSGNLEASKNKSKSGKKKKKAKDNDSSNPSSHNKKSGKHRQRVKEDAADSTKATPSDPPRSLTEL